MLPSDISNKILTIGINCKKPLGGIAMVEYRYSYFFNPFKFLKTSINDNFINKWYVNFTSPIKFIYILLNDHKIQIIHIHAASGRSFWRKQLYVNIAKLFKKKVVLHMHGGAFKQFAKSNYSNVAKIIKKADCIIALSDKWKYYYENTFDCKRIEVIKNIIEEPRKHPQKHEGFNLLFLGLIGDNKGIFDLLSVICKHKKEFNGKLKLIIGGNGEVHRLQSFVKNNSLSDIVDYEGWISGEKKIELLNKSDAFILPSYNEGVPLSILEALSYDIPVISTTVGGIPEIVTNNENGLLIAPGDETALYNAILKMMKKDYEYKKNDTINSYLPNVVEKQLFELYSSL